MQTGRIDYICERWDAVSILLAGNMLRIEFKVAGRSMDAALTARAVKSGISLFPVVKLDDSALYGGQKNDLSTN